MGPVDRTTRAIIITNQRAATARHRSRTLSREQRVTRNIVERIPVRPPVG